LSDTSALYEPLIERDLAAIPAAARTFAERHSVDELWLAITRFAVLAHSPSQHGKRAVMACRAAHEMREELGERWLEMIVACATYAAASRQPWTEPPILDPPQGDPGVDLREAVNAGDRVSAERWLASRLTSDRVHQELRAVATGDALLLLDTALALEPLLGQRGRYALLRLVLLELPGRIEEAAQTLEQAIDRAIEERGSIESVRNVLVAHAATTPAQASMPVTEWRLEPYELARDYAQTLLVHGIARTLPARAAELLAAVHYNLEHGESFAEWSFA